MNHRLRCGLRVLLLLFGCVTAAAAPSPTAEFESPYEVRVLPGGKVVEVSGSFSWALPQNFQAMLAQAPDARIVRLESPGGHVKPALELAAMIQARGLDTYVGRLCASACTLAFLGGRQRWLGPDGRLGFHQARAPGVASAELDPLLRQAYREAGVPGAFIAHVLRTPPEQIWFPTRDELRAAGFISGTAPEAVAAANDARSPDLSGIAALLAVAPDAELGEFALTLSRLLARLQEANPEACWAFAHHGPTDLRSYVPQDLLAAVATAREHVREAAVRTPVPTPDADRRRHAMAELIGRLRASGEGGVLAGLGAAADHAAFCPSLRKLIETALALPDASRGQALRTLLGGG